MDERFSGTWRLRSWENRDAAGAISHPVGREHRRTFAFPDAHRLQLSAPMEFGGRIVMACVTWRRA